MYFYVFIFLQLLSSVLADTGEYKTYYEQIAGGGWKLVRRVGRGEKWHPATDQLLGNDTYGTFFDNPTLSRTFSRKFDNEPFDQYLLSTGDGKKWLVVDKAQLLDYYTDRQRMIQTSALSKGVPYSARWSRRKQRKSDPQVCLKDCSKSIERGLMLYSENKNTKGAKPSLVPHNGANVFIRQRSYKVYVSGCCDYSMQGLLRKNGRVWADRTYKFKEFPSFLEGGTIAYGPYRHMPENTVLAIRVTHPSVVYLLLTAKPDRRNGGLDKTLPKQGWKKIPKQAHWGPPKRKYPLDIYRKLVDTYEVLPPTVGDQTVLSIIGKRRFFYVGDGKCVSEMNKVPCHFYKTQMSVHSCQKKCNLLEECIGWGASKAGKKCYLYFQETSGVVKSQKLLKYVWGGQNCGGMTVTKSSNEKDSGIPCFAKKEKDDKLVVKITSKDGDDQIAVGEDVMDFSSPDDYERRVRRLLTEAMVGDLYDDGQKGEVFEEGELSESALAADDIYDSLELEEKKQEKEEVDRDKEDEEKAEEIVKALDIEKAEAQEQVAALKEENRKFEERVKSSEIKKPEEKVSGPKEVKEEVKSKEDTKAESSEQGQAAVSMTIKKFPTFSLAQGEEEEEDEKDDPEMRQLVRQMGSTPCPDDRKFPIEMDKYAAGEDEEQQEEEDENPSPAPKVQGSKCPKCLKGIKDDNGLKIEHTKDSQGNPIVEKKDPDTDVVRELERKNSHGEKVVEKKDKKGVTAVVETYKDNHIEEKTLDVQSGKVIKVEKHPRPISKPVDIKTKEDLKDGDKDMQKKEKNKKDYPDRNEVTDEELKKMEAKEVVDFKEADSNEACCHFGPVVRLTPYEKIWQDRSFQFRKGIPAYMNGGWLVRGPMLIPQGKIIKITATRSCMIYLLLNIGERDGGWPAELVKTGWIKMEDEVKWHRPMAVYAKPVEHDFTFPETKTRNTVMSIIFKEPLTRGGNLLCYNGALQEEKYLQPPFKFKDRDPTRESCRYRCLQDFESEGYSYYTNGDSHECRCGARGKRMDELLLETNDKLNYRNRCEADDVSYFGWCTCETVIVHDLQNSCYGAANTGIYTLRDVNVPVYCEMAFAHGNWLLLATIKDVKTQYEGSTSPFVASKNPLFPKVTEAYSRDWRLITKVSPSAGDEFMIRRGSSNDHVRFVVDKWCGWGDQTTNCVDSQDTGHPFLATGTLYNEKDEVIKDFKYFNGCAMGGECGKDGIDGVGFGTKAGILSTKGGAKAYGGAVPGALFWGTDKPDKTAPYTFYYRPSQQKGFAELKRLNTERVERVATRERYEKSYLIFNSQEDHGKLEKLGVRGDEPEKLVIVGKDVEKGEKEVASKRSRRKHRRRSKRRRSRREEKEVAVGDSESIDSDEIVVAKSYHRSKHTRRKSKESNSGILENFGDVLSGLNVHLVKPQRRRLLEDSHA